MNTFPTTLGEILPEFIIGVYAQLKGKNYFLSAELDFTSARTTTELWQEEYPNADYILHSPPSHEYGLNTTPIHGGPAEFIEAYNSK